MPPDINLAPREEDGDRRVSEAVARFAMVLLLAEL